MPARPPGCCASHYTLITLGHHGDVDAAAASDDDGGDGDEEDDEDAGREVLALVVDRFLCPDTAARFRALGVAAFASGARPASSSCSSSSSSSSSP